MTRRDPTRPADWYCPATSHQTGEPCAARAGSGTNHKGAGLCKHHGGSTPGGRVQAGKILAGRFAARHAVPVAGADAVEELQHALERCAGRVHWLRAQIEDIEPEALWRGTTLMRRTETPDGVTTLTEAKPGVHVLWRLMMEEEDRLRAVARDLAHVRAVMMRLDGSAPDDLEAEAEAIVAQVLELAPALRRQPLRAVPGS